MNKRDMAADISQKLDIKRFEAYNFVNLMIEVMLEKLGNGEKIVLSGFGTLTLLKREKKKVINPNTKEAMVIPEGNIVKFFPSKILKKQIGE